MRYMGILFRRIHGGLDFIIFFFSFGNDKGKWYSVSKK